MELLNSRSQCKPSAVGALIHNLHTLKVAGLRVAPTIVIGNEIFREFAKLGCLPTEITNRIAAILQKERAFIQHGQVTIRSSVPESYVGLLEEVTVERSIASIQYGVEALYRSWSDDTARASRHVDGIDDARSIPAVFIQPAYDNPYMLATRTGYGEVTTAKNYANSIRNNIERFRPVYRTLLRQVERTMAFPTEVTLTQDRSPQIIMATRDEITDSGIWRTLSELFRDGIVSELDYLERVQPDMLVQFTDFAFSDPSSVSIGNGLPASPGTAVGRLCILGSRSGNIDDFTGTILVVAEASPEDVDAIHQCAGVVTVYGGMTSHAAVACRGLRKPLVINSGLEIDTRGGVVKHEAMATPADHSWYVCVNGSSGTISFSRGDSMTPRYKLLDECLPYVDQVVQALRCFDDVQKFSALPLPAQSHLARIRSELRKTGAVE
ncbi:pyruvate, phosphate dikinase [Rhodopirellula maiorica SM1]|uniref:Pyruvate, phosphate dikinase n=1 Tax=Rhodopirellula maiorica SM1 TaxID=1265738 RepID=M5RNV8_9BACT|nr:pyruvate, phosphate dikinase [Rhodopirellula maiorica SM1]